MTREEAIRQALNIADHQEQLNKAFHGVVEALRADQPDCFVDSTDYMFQPDATNAAAFAAYLDRDHQLRVRMEYGKQIPAWLNPPARLGQAMAAAEATCGSSYARVQRSALHYADRHHDRDTDGNLTPLGQDAAAAYLERTVEMWDVVPN